MSDYPTESAYLAACAAIEKHRERADKAEVKRDEYRGLSDHYSCLWRQERERADALAAHVKRIQNCQMQSGRISMCRLNEALQDSAETSLAQRDARVSAEALREAADHLYMQGTAAHLRLTEYADEIAAGKGEVK